MNIAFIRNNKGVTIVELIVALGISSILLVFVISGSLFVQNYIRGWSQTDKLAEELVFLSHSIQSDISSSRQILLRDDSLICVSPGRSTVTYHWKQGAITRNERSLIRSGFKIDTLSIGNLPLPESDSSRILEIPKATSRTGLYQIWLVVSDGQNEKDSITFLVKNAYEYLKATRR